MSLYKPYVPSTTAGPKGAPLTEFDILRASHRFLRDDTDADASTSWNDQLAKKYYDSLYREFAICDLKHYKSGNFALRWRTESEVLDGTGESSCANTRCERHRRSASTSPDLSTLELPFTYEEHGKRKEALVKIVLCPRCVRKLTWKRRHDRHEGKKGTHAAEQGRDREADDELMAQPTSESFGARRRARTRSRSPQRREGGRSSTRRQL